MSRVPVSLRPIAPALLLWAVGGTGCVSSPSLSRDSAPAEAAEMTDTASPEPLTHRFSMAVIADPHVTGPGEHADRLEAAVDWVEAHASDRDIKLTVILGDICWGEGFGPAHAALERLSMPWVPVMGDNVIQAGEESLFHATFEGQLQDLSGSLSSFSIAPTPVWNPEREVNSWLQNFSFEFGGIRFLAVDWNSRERGSIWGETPDLHNFTGGTWPWLTEQLDALGTRPTDSVILLSHMPLFEGIGGLTADEADHVVSTLAPYADVLWANLAGHLHWSTSSTWDRGGIEVHVTDATWDDRNTLRVIDVSANDERFTFTHALVEVD